MKFQETDNNICNYSADYPVYVSTQQNETFDNENFQLRAGTDTLLLPGVLCENGMYYEGFKCICITLPSNGELWINFIFTYSKNNFVCIALLIFTQFFSELNFSVIWHNSIEFPAIIWYQFENYILLKI